MSKVDKAFLRSLVETPSVTGCEEDVATLVRERLVGVADTVETDVMGSVHAVLKGTEKAPSVMIAAHMDEVGLMVKSISDTGFLSVVAVGGVDAAVLPGMRVDVHTQKGVVRGVVGRKPIHLIDADERSKVTPLSQLFIDLGLTPRRVREVVRVGDVITYGVGFERLGKGMAVSRGFDDKAGVYVAVRVMEELARAGRAKGDYICATTVQEEIGLRGGGTSAYSVHPDVAIALDATHATDYPGIDQARFGNVICGQGPVVARGPNCNPVVVERLIDAASSEGIEVQFEAEPGLSGTDAQTMQIQRGGIVTGLVSVALRYMHTPTEVIKLSDLEQTVSVLTRFILDLTEDTTFVPGM